MQRSAVLATLPFLLAGLRAQCLDTSGGVSAGIVPLAGFTADDEGRSAPIDMMFGTAGFPMAGAVGGPFTHVVVDANGAVYLTNGGPAIGPVDFGAFELDDLRGLAGSSPRVFAAWTDLEGPATTWTVKVDTSVAGRCKITWVDVQEFLGAGDRFSASISLFDTGVVELAFSDLPADLGLFQNAFAGISIGNGVGTGAELPVDLTAGSDSGTLGLLFDAYFGAETPSVSGAAVTLVPNGNGGYTAIQTCVPPRHIVRGSGCYGDSVYQLFDDSALASAALTGNSLTLLPTATGYTAVWIPGGAATFVAPSGATDLPRVDDGQNLLDLGVLIAPGTALPTPAGPVSTLYVHSNGFVSTAANNLGGAWNDPSGVDYIPSPSFRNAPATAFWAWHDWDPTDTTGGPIRWHHDTAANVLYVTWDGVESYAEPEVPNPGTFQFQFDLSTGVVNYVWQDVDDDTSSPFGSAHLVGYSPGGASVDPGPIPFAVAGGTTTIQGFAPLTLRATPDPILLPGGNSNSMTYTVGNMPDFAPPNGARIGILVFSVGSAPGIDLGLIGAPGCQAHIASLDVQLPIAVVGSADQSMPLVFPAPLSVGQSFFAQAVALFPAGSYPGGLNAFGLLTSNGLETRF